MKRFSRRVAAAAGAVLMSFSLTVPAAAQSFNDFERGALDFHAQATETIEQWNVPFETQLKEALDGAYGYFYPNLLQRQAEAKRQAKEAARLEGLRQAQVARVGANDCPVTADACVDLAGGRSWLQENGVVTYGPVQVGIGRPGHETPRGSHLVNRQVRDEVSYIFDMAPMPFATYFTYNGIAFHAGDPNILSHGCVRMWLNDAEHYFNALDIGDEVFVY